jgi:hypothetical protein
VEDKNPDKRVGGMTSDGATKREDEKEFFAGDGDNDADADYPHKSTNKRQYLTQHKESSAEEGEAGNGPDTTSSNMDVE